MRGAPELVVAPRVRPVGSGAVRRLLPYRLRRQVGPFIFADLMGPDPLPPGSGVDVDAHPHIGLATVTYLFAGALVHRDSTGVVQRIEPGAVNWMSAGGGVCHTERSPDDERVAASVLAGLQTWVALPIEQERGEPGFQHHPADTMPEAMAGDAVVRVVAGDGFGLQSPVTVASPLVLAELRLPGGGRSVVPPDHPELAAVVVEGRVTVGGTPVPEGHLAVLAPGAATELVAVGAAHVMLLGGEPVGPRRIWWNFVASTEELLEDARRRWRDQRFPKVPGDHDPWVPAPGS